MNASKLNNLLRLWRVRMKHEGSELAQELYRSELFTFQSQSVSADELLLRFVLLLFLIESPV